MQKGGWKGSRVAGFTYSNGSFNLYEPSPNQLIRQLGATCQPSSPMPAFPEALSPDPISSNQLTTNTQHPSFGLLAPSIEEIALSNQMKEQEDQGRAIPKGWKIEDLFKNQPKLQTQVLYSVNLASEDSSGASLIRKQGDLNNQKGMGREGPASLGNRQLKDLRTRITQLKDQNKILERVMKILSSRRAIESKQKPFEAAKEQVGYLKSLMEGMMSKNNNINCLNLIFDWFNDCLSNNDASL